MRTRRSSRRAVAVLGAMVGLLLIGWGVGRALVATVGAADLAVVRDVASDRTPALTEIAHVLSLLGSGFVLFPLATVLTVALVLRREPRSAVAVALGTAGGVLLSNLDKVLVARPRPPVRHLEHVVTFSFPSGHATQTSAFCVAVLLVFLTRRPTRGVRRAAIAVAVLVVLGVGASRVCLGVHYPSDVVAGAALGTAWSLLLARAVLTVPTLPPPFGREARTPATARLTSRGR